jgi:hypothetical protein
VAEILIQRKRRRSVWPWLLGLLAMALLLLPFLGGRNGATVARERVARRDTVARPDTTGPRDTASRTAVAASRGGAPESPARTTAIAAGAIAPAPPALPTASSAGVDTVARSPAIRPAAGTAFERFIAAGNRSVDERAHRRYTTNGLRRLADELRTLGASEAGVRTIRANADSVMSTARASMRPDFARAAFLAAVREFDLLGGRYSIPVDTGRLRAAAWSITPNRRLLAQRGTVQTFFESARDALHSLSRRR